MVAGLGSGVQTGYEEMSYFTHRTEASRKPKLLDQVREAIRTRHYSIRTEQAYVQWIRRFILFHRKRHPVEMGAPEFNTFLSHLATKRKVSASTQNQALSALLFLYREVLHLDPGILEDVVRAKKSKKLPVVLIRDEVKAVINELTGVRRIMVHLLYGSGLPAYGVPAAQSEGYRFLMPRGPRQGRKGKERSRLHAFLIMNTTRQE